MTTPERPYCGHCQRPLRTCVCRWIVPLSNLVEVIILQHPLETHNAKNTARLLHLSLQQSRLVEGEQFTDDFLAALLGEGDKTNVLLYPPTPEEATLKLTAPAPLPQLPLPEHIRLIVIDGTWRKSRKMLYLNPLLQALPRLSLADCPPSAYAIRKAQKDNQLSTLEASCYALQQLENTRVDYAPLLQAFKGFVRQQQAFIPPRH
ncbi:tRNA-uridine aminocarboxypropyltransferase [Cellvibrio sp. ARAG 10.3]|uniref:tRNA-uridine aminocarboxypropyltransferase n=1 Tax=Cellvibrio sp. ARAG 10.3 TaxID=3451358 RepID=UPI003F4462FF